MMEIGPGESQRIDWLEPFVFHVGYDACGCACSDPEFLDRPDLEPHYVVAGIESWSGYTCLGACAPDDLGLIRDATPFGERFCALADAWLPVSGDLTLVLGGAGCWDDWESGP
jgi:hypothetical protein